jgi:hypothetical protein
MIYTDNRQVGCMTPPSFHKIGDVWDLAFFNPIMKKFIQINTFKEYECEREYLMKFYFKFFKYLNQQNQFYNFSIIFGFNEGAFKYDDYHIPEEKFISRLRQLDIQWISEHIKDEKELQEQQDNLEIFFMAVANACKNFFGEVCLKKVVERFEPHIGVGQKSASMQKSTKLGPTAKLNLK